MTHSGRMPDGERSAPSDRRDQVRRLVLGSGFARTDELARQLGVSVMTVHRDLDVLAAEGWLTKIRGGATANPSALAEAGVRERSAAMRAEKEAVARQAAHHLGPGQTVFIDDSTTALALLPHLAAAAPLTVATNFMPAVEEMSGLADVEVIVLGGRYHRPQEACFGLQTVEAIRQLRADVLFMSTTAVTGGSCYHRSETTVLVKRALMECSVRRVLLVDHAKFGRPAPHLLCPVDAFEVLVTDAGIDEEELADLRQRDLAVEVAVV
jgi:DeoR/GlpR family transcriptional regulator of sugar metabolism